MAKYPMNLTPSELSEFLLEKADRFETRDFIPDDPISIPHGYSDAADAAMAGLFTALIAWGNRKAILKSAYGMMERMDHAPDCFVRQASKREIQRAFKGFVHRTFQPEDVAVVCAGLQQALAGGRSLETLFAGGDAHARLAAFHDVVFEGIPGPHRTRKHVADPRKGSAAKRLNMYLRWMVRPAARGVDLGLWNAMQPADLMIPLDVHTSTIGRKLGLLERRANDWKAVEELTASLRKIDPLDPVRLDFALFGLGAIEGF